MFVALSAGVWVPPLTSTDLNAWYNILTLVDKFALGVLESFNTHTNDYTGAIGQVKYFSTDLTNAEILVEAKGGTHTPAERATNIAATLQFNVTYDDDGITDAGLGADNGTLTGNAHYAGYVSSYSRAIERNVTGHAAEVINSFPLADRILSIIKRGD